MNHQFELFGYVKPKRKIPIDASRIKLAKQLMERGDVIGAAIKMREVREALEDFEKRILNKRYESNHRNKKKEL